MTVGLQHAIILFLGVFSVLSTVMSSPPVKVNHHVYWQKQLFFAVPVLTNDSMDIILFSGSNMLLARIDQSPCSLAETTPESGLLLSSSSLLELLSSSEESSSELSLSESSSLLELSSTSPSSFLSAIKV